MRTPFAELTCSIASKTSSVDGLANTFRKIGNYVKGGYTSTNGGRKHRITNKTSMLFKSYNTKIIQLVHVQILRHRLNLPYFY